MRLSPDQLIFWQSGAFKLNGTIVFTWGLMLVLALGAKLITRKLSTELSVPAGRTCSKSSSPASKNKSRKSDFSSGEVYRISGHPIPIRRPSGPLHDYSRL